MNKCSLREVEERFDYSEVLFWREELLENPPHEKVITDYLQLLNYHTVVMQSAKPKEVKLEDFKMTYKQKPIQQTKGEMLANLRAFAKSKGVK